MEFELELDRIDLDAVNEMRHGRNLAMTLSDNTRKGYMLAARQFNEFLQSKGMKVNEDSLKLFFAENKFWSPTTVNLKRQALMKIIQCQPEISDSYLKRAQVNELFKENIPRVKGINQAIKEGKYISEFQIKKLIEKATKRIGLMMKFAFVTGVRVSEMINIKLCDVIENRYVFEVKIVGKGSKQRDQYVDKRIVREIFETFNSKVYLFETINQKKYNRRYVWREMQKVGAKCGMKVYPHIFRHSCGMHLWKKKKGADFIQKTLGHSDVVTTYRFYFHNEPDRKITRCFNV